MALQRERRRGVSGLSWQLSFSREVGTTLPKRQLMATNNLQNIYCIQSLQPHKQLMAILAFSKATLRIIYWEPLWCFLLNIIKYYLSLMVKLTTNFPGMRSHSSPEDYDTPFWGLALKLIQKPLNHRLSSEISHKITRCRSSASLSAMPLSKETQWQWDTGEADLVSSMVLERLRGMEFTQLRHGKLGWRMPASSTKLSGFT